MNQTEQLKQIIDYYGDASQIDKAIEEMSELTQALLKHRIASNKLAKMLGAESRKSICAYVKKDADAYANVKEEIADVQIMLEQLKILFNGGEKTEKIMQEKIDRTLQRIEEEKNEI